MALLNWIGEHTIFTFFLAYMLIKGAVLIVALPFRAMNIRKHGWPPEHLDADGYYKKPKAEEAK